MFLVSGSGDEQVGGCALFDLVDELCGAFFRRRWTSTPGLAASYAFSPAPALFREAAAKTSTLPEAAWLLDAEAVDEEEFCIRIR